MLYQSVLTRLTLQCNVIATMLELKENYYADIPVLIIFSILLILQYWYKYNHPMNLHAKLNSCFVINKHMFSGQTCHN